MITPTVGRVVWYRPDDGAEQRFAAHVAYVHPYDAASGNYYVNLMVIDPSGIAFNCIKVRLVQDGEAPAPGECEWMPYQKGQAAKTEQLEQQIKA